MNSTSPTKTKLTTIKFLSEKQCQGFPNKNRSFLIPIGPEQSAASNDGYPQSARTHGVLELTPFAPPIDNFLSLPPGKFTPQDIILQTLSGGL